MEQNQKPESIQQLFTQVQQQLKLTLVSQDSRSAKQAMVQAEKAMAKIEGLVLADPAVTPDDLRCVVEFTRGTIWVQARRHMDTLNQSRSTLAAA